MDQRENGVSIVSTGSRGHYPQFDEENEGTYRTPWLPHAEAVRAASCGRS